MELNFFENNSENSLVEIIGNKIVVSSRQVAQNFEKRHPHVLDSIKQLINSATQPKSRLSGFIKTPTRTVAEKQILNILWK